MREYKFRGKKDTGEWVIGGILQQDGYTAICVYSDYHQWHEFIEVDPETVGQYTGVTDKNGKSIFDGQTVLITGEQELDFGLFFQWNDKAVVRWSDDECGYYLDVINKREVRLYQDGYFTVDTFPLRKWDEEEWSIEYEVIDNPDLLEVTHG